MLQYGLSLITPPDELPISLAQIKLHCRVDHDEENDYLTELIKAATIKVEKEISRQLVTATLKMHIDSFGDCEIALPRSPLRTVSAIEYYDTDDELQTFSAANWQYNNKIEPGIVAPISGVNWPSVATRMNAVSITFTAGYGAAADVPATLKAAIRLIAGHWYLRREDVSALNLKPIPMGYASLLAIESTGEYY